MQLLAFHHPVILMAVRIADHVIKGGDARHVSRTIKRFGTIDGSGYFTVLPVEQRATLPFDGSLNGRSNEVLHTHDLGHFPCANFALGLFAWVEEFLRHLRLANGALEYGLTAVLECHQIGFAHTAA